MNYIETLTVLSKFTQKEIERKFLVDLQSLPQLSNGKTIEQGYLNIVEAAETRIRVTDGERASIITKDNNKLTRSVSGEYIPLENGLKMLSSCASRIKKVRYRYKHRPTDTYTWELDRFAGPLSGFWMAEVELTSEKQKIEYPKFITEEVTDDEEYRNSRLSLI